MEGYGNINDPVYRRPATELSHRLYGTEFGSSGIGVDYGMGAQDTESRAPDTNTRRSRRGAGSVRSGSTRSARSARSKVQRN
jgi:hypothetical protein